MNNQLPSCLQGLNHSIFIRPNSSKVVIFFAAINMSENQFNFWQVGRELDENVIFVNDTTNQWYINGVPSLGSGFEETIHVLKNWIEFFNTDEIYTIGTSMGAHAAINYGIELNANILSFPVEVILREEHSRSIKCLKSDLVERDFLIKKIRAFKKSIYILVGESEPKDLLSASYLRNFENVYICSLLGVNHYVPSMLSKSGVLYKLITRFVDKGIVDYDVFSNLGRFNDYDDEIFAHLQQAVHHFHVGSYVTAIDFSKKILVKHAFFESALAITGESYLKEKDYKLAASYLAKATTLAPNNSDYLFKYSHAIRKSGDRATALYLLELLIERFPNYAKAYYVKGVMSLEVKDEVTAYHAFKIASALDKKNQTFEKRYVKLALQLGKHS